MAVGAPHIESTAGFEGRTLLLMVVERGQLPVVLSGRRRIAYSRRSSLEAGPSKGKTLEGATKTGFEGKFDNLSVFKIKEVEGETEEEDKETMNQKKCGFRQAYSSPLSRVSIKSNQHPNPQECPDSEIRTSFTYSTLQSPCPDNVQKNEAQGRDTPVVFSRKQRVEAKEEFKKKLEAIKRDLMRNDKKDAGKLEALPVNLRGR
eukprot:1342093-Amorphochlora_amoeboformis.AAC.1